MRPALSHSGLSSREQRRREARAAGRKSQRGVIKPLAWQHIAAHMTLSNTSPLQEVSRNAIVLPAYQALDRLTKGAGDAAGYLDLVEMNYFGHRLAQRLAEFSNAAEQLRQTEPEFTAAGEALAAIGERSNITGRFTPKGDELRLIRASMQMLDELLGLSTAGHALSALKQAAQDIEATQRAVRSPNSYAPL